MNTEEKWLPIPGYEGRYEVSDRGRVRSVDRVINGCRHRGRIRKPSINDGGYESVVLSVDGKDYCWRVNRLVLTTFVGPCQDGMEGRHKNGKRADNRLTNLAWGTKIENAADRDRHGNTPYGERHGKTSLIESDVIEIRRLRSDQVSLAKIAAQFSISVPAVSAIVTRRNWKYLP